MNQSQGTTAPSPSTRTPGVGQQFGVPGPSPAPLHTTVVATRTPNHGKDGGVPHWGCTPRAPLSLIAEFPISSLPPAGGGEEEGAVPKHPVAPGGAQLWHIIPGLGVLASRHQV